MGGEAVHFLFSGHEIKGVADHFGGFRAWIPERSDFFKGPKGPKGPLGSLLTVLIKLLFKDSGGGFATPAPPLRIGGLRPPNPLELGRFAPG